MTAPTQQEIDEVDAGLNDRLVDAAFEPRDPDEFLAAMQDDRDRMAYQGDFERAEAWDAELANLRAPEVYGPVLDEVGDEDRWELNR